MRFLFWTFLDIFKMSIFGFLKIIFFRHTEKSENKNDCNCLSENGKEIIKYESVFLENFENYPQKWTFLNVVVVDTDTTATTKLYKNHIEISKIVIYIFFIYAVKKHL